MTKLFGTDGIRAVAGQPPLDFQSVYALGKALVHLLKEEGFSPLILIGRDTRESGLWIERVLVQGIADSQGETVSAGILPTSAISFLTQKHAFAAGIVISASHNPYQDNGIKIFSSLGMKISEDWEDRLEKALLDSWQTLPPKEHPYKINQDMSKEYMEFLQSRFLTGSSHKKRKIVIDCSNGASSFFAPAIFQRLGYDVVTIHAAPDGKNINSGCGSLYPEILARTVLETQADMGIAYDGDADRMIWADEKGKILNGDYTLFVLSRHMNNLGTLKSKSIVATTMSNMGLERALERFDLKLIRTQVGDKYVLEEMIKIKANLGGEQSGHTILLDECPTGDGILTSLKILEALEADQIPISELVSEFKEFPQILLNVPVSKKEDLNLYPEIMSAAEEVERALCDAGRMNIRFSGTEPLVRIMVEGRDSKAIAGYANKIAESVIKCLGTK